STYVQASGVAVLPLDATSREVSLVGPGRHLYRAWEANRTVPLTASWTSRRARSTRSCLGAPSEVKPIGSSTAPPEPAGRRSADQLGSARCWCAVLAGRGGAVAAGWSGGGE